MSINSRRTVESPILFVTFAHAIIGPSTSAPADLTDNRQARTFTTRLLE